MSDDNIASLPREYATSVVGIVTELLQAAQDDKIRILAIAYVHDDGDVVYRVSAGEGLYKLIGALEGMKFDMLKEKQG